MRLATSDQSYSFKVFQHLAEMINLHYASRLAPTNACPLRSKVCFDCCCINDHWIVHTIGCRCSHATSTFFGALTKVQIMPVDLLDDVGTLTNDGGMVEVIRIALLRVG